jgi:hypothetical protein
MRSSNDPSIDGLASLWRRSVAPMAGEVTIGLRFAKAPASNACSTANAVAITPLSGKSSAQAKRRNLPPTRRWRTTRLTPQAGKAGRIEGWRSRLLRAVDSDAALALDATI